MQIDFHHAVTYVVARIAGFDHKNAEVIAYSSQYVDDATNSGTILFDSHAMYARICSAHKMLDSRNLSEQKNHHVWIPFHFLPGNGGMSCTENQAATFLDKVICCPDSQVAADMIKACIEDRANAYGLHRLGITMHVYSDTWAHQGFAGVSHLVNKVSSLNDINAPGRNTWRKIKEGAGDLWGRVKSYVLNTLPLGHGGALNYPDLPYLTWEYQDYKKNRIKRNNTDQFVIAADAMCKSMRRYREGNADAGVAGLSQRERDQIRDLFLAITDESCDKRHAKWLQAIDNGAFSFGPVKIYYQDKGPGSWKHKALGTTEEFDKGIEIYAYDELFLTSDWKMFHDALQAHRFTVIYDILPKYGICAA